MATRTVGYDEAGNAKTYTGATDISDAVAASSAGDVIEVYYADAYKNEMRSVGTSVVVDKDVTIRGMISHCRLFLVSNPSSVVLNFQSSCTIENLRMRSAGNAFVVYTNQAVTVAIKRCKLYAHNGDDCIYWGHASATLNMESCMMTCHNGICTYTLLGTCNFYNCAIVDSYNSNGGYGCGFDNWGGTVNCYNCYVKNTRRGYSYVNSIGGSCNASYDNTEPGTGGVSLESSDPKFWNAINTVWPGDDYRIRTGSSLAGAGANHSIPYDLAGRAFKTPPSIGPYEVWDPPTELAANSVLNTAANYVILDGTYRTPTAEAGSANGVSPGVGNVRLNIPFSVRGDLANSVGVLALPSAANVVLNCSYGSNATEFTGTFDETARNTSPGNHVVLSGSTWLLAGANQTGTLETFTAADRTKLTELHQSSGLDASNTVTLVGDGVAQTVKTVAGMTVTYLPTSIKRT